MEEGSNTIAVVPHVAWYRSLLRYGPYVDDVMSGPARTHATSGSRDESVALRFGWRPIGEVSLDVASKLVFPPTRRTGRVPP